MKGIIVIALTAALLTGCAPSRSAWIESMNAFAGTRFDAHLYADCSHGCGDSYWSPVNRNHVYDRVVEEGDSQRFYITWFRNCRYSVLVSKAGIFQTWRYETPTPESCYIF